MSKNIKVSKETKVDVVCRLTDELLNDKDILSDAEKWIICYFAAESVDNAAELGYAFMPGGPEIVVDAVKEMIDDLWREKTFSNIFWLLTQKMLLNLATSGIIVKSEADNTNKAITPYMCRVLLSADNKEDTVVDEDTKVIPVVSSQSKLSCHV